MRHIRDVVWDGLTLEEHLILHEAWLKNDQFGGIRIDLSGRDLSNVNMPGVDLRLSICNYANFSNSNMRLALMSGSLAVGACFYKTYIPFAYLCDCEFTAASFGGADMRKSQLDSSKFFCADLKSADLRGVSLSCTVFDSADLSNAHVSADLFKKAFGQMAKVEAARVDNHDLINRRRTAKIS